VGVRARRFGAETVDYIIETLGRRLETTGRGWVDGA
jgi:hypothetical protein